MVNLLFGSRFLSYHYTHHSKSKISNASQKAVPIITAYNRLSTFNRIFTTLQKRDGAEGAEPEKAMFGVSSFGAEGERSINTARP
jgi:hypothetical protein